MQNYEKFIESLGALAEMAALFQRSLMNAGLDSESAATLTAKMLVELIHGKCGGE